MVGIGIGVTVITRTGLPPVLVTSNVVNGVDNVINGADNVVNTA